jgi:asparagine synthase (glutamine-hydrolysing)
MCGVAAIAGGRLRADESDRLIRAVTASLAHRGPDHSACVISDGVALGHTRLRVVDSSAAADQPMSFGAAHLSFSGAITNYRELRDELRRERGVVFRTRGDTEVLLHALRLFGDSALDRIKGMFAFVYYDGTSGRLVAARDRYGIKPLVWARRTDGTLLIASEAQALLRATGIDRSVDPVALRQLLRFNHPLGERTFFQHIRSIQPGCVMRVDVASGEATLRRWGALRMEPRSVDRAAAVDSLDHSFRNAIKRAIDVDVPLGCYLSGGVDSSGIVAELLRQRATPRLYSLVLPGVKYSEERAIDRATRLFGVSTTKVPIQGLTLDHYVQYALRSEMPQWWTSDLALAGLARSARRDGTAVALTGEGPDELFAGYEVYRVARFRGLLTRAGELFGDATGAATGIARRFVPWLGVDVSVARAYLASHARCREAEIVEHFGFHPENLALWELLDGRRPLAAGLSDDAAYREIERSYFRDVLAPAATGLSPIEQNLMFEITERLPRWILHMGDRMSSTFGVELRFPYLDDDFVAEAMKLPMRLRATVQEDKRVLRRMHRRRLPRAIAKRPKQPLYTPTADWLEPVLSDARFTKYWSRRAFERAGLLDFDVCDAARARLAKEAPGAGDSVTAMADEWLFSFALTTSILAVDLCGA